MISRRRRSFLPGGRCGPVWPELSDARAVVADVPNPAPFRLVRPPLPPAVALEPDPAQEAVLAHGAGPLLVLAGPGTGKTTTLVELVARRVEAGLDPAAVLLLTFSRRAAEELRERLASRLAGSAAAPTAWTFHAWCYATVRERQDAEAWADPLRLLSGPEQDVALRDLLSGSLELGRAWPASVRPAVPTRGFAEEVRGLLARAREAGLEPTDLAALAGPAGRPEWTALAGFAAEYLDVLDAQGAVDYAELVHRAVLLAEQPEAQAQLRGRHRLVVVDEYQDTDPAQERLLRALAGDGRDLVVVGDPDQAIYAFRGADVGGLLRFPDRFPQADGSPAPVVALRTCRRSAPELIEVSRRVAMRVPAPGLPVARLKEHRALLARSGGPAGSVEVVTHPSEGAQAEAVADLLRREHLEDGTPWGRMAVLVRSGARSVPLLRRVLGAAGVPVEVAADELPLAREPAVAPLLLGMRVADDPAQLTAETARLLLVSPLGGADAAGLRRLGRALRRLDERGTPGEEGPHRLPRPSAELLRAAVADASMLVEVEPRVARPVERLARLLAAARRELHPSPGDRAGGPEAALWALWSGSPWPRRLEEASTAGGAAGRAADRDLDAVVSLTAAVARASERRGGVAAVGPLLDELQAQQIPGDTLADRGVRGEGVRLLTAHRSKGLEWDVVCVVGVQDGVWPDLRSRSSLLQSERLAPLAEGGLREPAGRAELLADERRLLYVALTRARRRVVVTAVDTGEEDGDRPSQLLAELGVGVRRVRQRPAAPLSLSAVVAALRRRAVDAAASPAMRTAARSRLARLTAERAPDGTPLVPAADPDGWWGLLATSVNDEPVQAPGQPVALSGTSLTGLGECPLRWFLQHEVHADRPATTAMGFGGVLHALADEVATGRTPAELDALVERLDKVWDQLAYEAPWQSVQQHTAATEALARFLAWHAAARGRTLLATEERFEVDIELPSGTARLRGFVDRVELDADGRVHVVDFKTGRNPGSDASVATHPQLATYQLAVRRGALDEATGGRREPGGGELVHLRVDRGGSPRVQPQPPLPADGAWVEDALDAAVQRVLAEDFRPQPSEQCERCDFRRACPARPEGRQVVA
jgi:superfamily I DNA/RNA helicase/RecB family exonuclease